MVETFITNFEWVLRLCDHVRYHEDGVDMGVSKRRNPEWKDNLYDYQPEFIYGAAWFLDACGFELCFEIIDTSFTIRHPRREIFQLSCADWGFVFRFESLGFLVRTIFQKRTYGYPNDVRVWGDPDAFARAKTLLELALPLREDVYYKRGEPVGLIEIGSPWAAYRSLNHHHHAMSISGATKQQVEELQNRQR